MKDPYQILGVGKDANDDEIKKAYRRLAKEHHPDKTGGDDTRFKEIAHAYDILSDPQKKAQWNNQSRFGGGFDDQFFEEFLRNQGFSDMFNQRYGWSNGKGSDVRANIQIRLEDAYYGTSRELRLGTRNISVNIPPGVKNGQRLRLKGLGQRGMTEDMNGDLILTVQVLDHPEFFLDNRGLHTIKRVNMFDALLGAKDTVTIFDKTITYTIPKLTQNGTMLRVKGKGFPHYNNADQCGDLYINIAIEMPKDLTEEETQLAEQLKQKIDERKG